MMDDGVGAGVVQNGAVFDGHKGYAGEIGHISIDVNGPRCQCGNYGCLELYCSAIEFVKEASGFGGASEKLAQPSLQF